MKMQKRAKEEKVKIIIFGYNPQARLVISSLNRKSAVLIAFADSDKAKQAHTSENGVPVNSPYVLNELDFDFIVVNVLKKRGQVRAQLESLGVCEEKIVDFYFQVEKDKYSHIFDIEKWSRASIMEELSSEIAELRERETLWKNNSLYEIAEIVQKRELRFPHIEGREETIKKLLDEKCSICRIGDAEFGIIQGVMWAAYQKPGKELADRLLDILHSNEETILIGIPPYFGSLQDFTDSSAYDIRQYMNRERRTFLESIIDYEKTYYDAYLFRPYINYKDKSNTEEKFNVIRKLWDRRDVVIIEGKQTRMGVGNDLLDNCRSIRRILCPSENAFDCYNAILDQALSMGKDKLFLIPLGATATVLAYDLALAGRQAVDIGQVDIEYEWFKRNAVERVDIPDKYVHEVCGGHTAVECLDDDYRRQIVVEIF